VGADHKRIHAAFELLRAGNEAPAAAAEMMLLHVRQQGTEAKSAPFPADVSAAIARLAAATAAMPAAVPGSRRMELRATTGAS
jgi:acyl-CoA thioesterase FadM